MTSRKRVLLADGSEEFRWLMWKNVANHDFFSLATVGSGRDVLLCMQKQTADLLLMDTALPDVCGLTVLDELQRRGTAPQRVILLSSIVSEQVTDQAFALGVSQFIPKPFHTDLLFDAMYELFPGCSCGHWPHSPQWDTDSPRPQKTKNPNGHRKRDDPPGDLRNQSSPPSKGAA